jgi:hypothetical protein
MLAETRWEGLAFNCGVILIIPSFHKYFLSPSHEWVFRKTQQRVGLGASKPAEQQGWHTGQCCWLKVCVLLKSAY